MLQPDNIALLAKYTCASQITATSLEQAERDTSLFINSDKTGVMSFKLEGTIITLCGMRLKLEHQFTYLDSNL